MLAIELKRIIKDSTIIFMILGALGAAIMCTDQNDYLAPTLEVFLLLYASFAGWSMFERERQENAMEYMLSLPLSRLRLLIWKFLPRLLSVAVILSIYLFLHRYWHLPSFLTPINFAVLYSGFFLLSSAFSLSLKNFISAFFLTSLLTLGQIFLIKIVDEGEGISQAIFQSSMTILVFPILFIILFKNFDIKPISYFNRKFFPCLLLLAAFIGVYTFFTARISWHNYFVSKNGWILRCSCRYSETIQGKSIKRYKGCLTILRETEEGNQVFLLERGLDKSKKCVQKRLAILDAKTEALNPFYRIPEGWSVVPGYSGEIGGIKDGTYSLFLQNNELKKNKLITLKEGKVSEFPVGGDFYDPQISYVFYLDSQPGRLLIFSKSRLYKLHLSGLVEEIGQFQSFAVWKDKILLFESTGLSLYQTGEKLNLLLQKKGKFTKSRRRIGGFESRYTIYRSEGSYFFLDLNLQKEEKLELKSQPFTYQQSGEILNIVSAKGSTFTIKDIQGGKQSETVWDSGFQPAGIRISPFGLLLFKEQEYKVYTFKN